MLKDPRIIHLIVIILLDLDWALLFIHTYIERSPQLSANNFSPQPESAPIIPYRSQDNQHAQFLVKVISNSVLTLIKKKIWHKANQILSLLDD